MRPKGHLRRASGTSQISCIAFVGPLETIKPARLRLLCEKKRGDDDVTPLTPNDFDGHPMLALHTPVNNVGGHPMLPSTCLREEGKKRRAPVS
jgi:hypothetical protein